MSTRPTNKGAAPTPKQSAPPSLQDDAAAAPESAWFFAWFKSAMLYLAAVTAYLGAVIALVKPVKTLLAETGVIII